MDGMVVAVKIIFGDELLKISKNEYYEYDFTATN